MLKQLLEQGALGAVVSGGECEEEKRYNNFCSKIKEPTRSRIAPEFNNIEVAIN